MAIHENCFVIDFEYKGVKFALDFTAASQPASTPSQPASQPASQVVNVDFVRRNNALVYTKRHTLKKKENIHLLHCFNTTALHTLVLNNHNGN
ncbi:hypothetical protein LQT47_17045 [Escherichia coli]|nr:hypothetical protein LQT47_17045 [Escherichia coli]